MRNTKKTLSALALGTLLTASCADQASVGAEPSGCYPGIECRDAKLKYTWSEADPSAVANTANLAKLEPTWTVAALPGVDAHFTSNVSNHLEGFWSTGPGILLALGPADQLWAFIRAETHLAVCTLDSSGKVLGQAEVAPPAGVRVPPKPALSNGAIYEMGSANSHPSGPVVTLEWEGTCTPDDGSAPQACARGEMLAFSGAVNTPPRRFQPDFEISSILPGSGFRTHRGDKLLAPVQLAGFEEIEVGRTGSWQSELPSSFAVGKYLYDAALSPTDVLTLSVASQKANTVAPYMAPPFEILELTPEKATLTRLTFVQGPYPEYRSSPPRLHYDPTGKLWLITTTEDGYLYIARRDGPDSGTNATILRDDLLSLTPRASSMDPAGNLYIATVAGNRSTQTSVLCRVSADLRQIKCVNVDPVVDAMQAAADGVVFTSSDKGIQRFDFGK